MSRLPGAEWIVNARNAGGTYSPGAFPWRFTLHTTEAVPSSLDGARAMAARHKYPPHLWYWPQRDWLGQTVPLDRSAFALVQPKGAPPTNKAHAIQVEVIGHADQTASWPGEWWDRIGRRILRPVIDLGYPVRLDEVAATTGHEGYGADGKVRMSWTAWAHFGGVCCHANVPGNEHWDIGRGDLKRVAAAAAPLPPEPPEVPAMAGLDNAVRPTNGEILRVGRGTDGKLWLKVENAAWGVFDGSAGGRPDSNLAAGGTPAITCRPDGRAVITVKGTDAKAYDYRENSVGGSWTGPIGVGGLFD